jgi:outer membrane protein assembly factor BamB
MAQGRAQGKAGTGFLITVAIVMTLLVSTGVWNPFPDLWAFINTSGPLSDPATRWQERLGGVPQAVTVLDRYVVVEHREQVEVRNRSDGRQLWATEADWAAVAGSGNRTVVVAGTLLVKGYRVLDPATGAVIRRDEQASAVWTYADALLDMSCRASADCELVAHEPASGEEQWRVGLPGIGLVLFADNPDLLGSVPIAADRISALAQPAALPALLGFPIDGRVQLVDTANGRVLPPVSPDRQNLVVTAGGRVVHSEVKPREGGCDVTLVGRDAVTGGDVWRRVGYSLHTISGTGCEQRRRPAGGGSALLATRPDGREAVLDAGDGREVLVCAAGEKVLATDGVHAVLRSADGAQLSLHLLGSQKPLWARRVHVEATAAVLGGAVVIVDRAPDRVIVLEAATGRVRSEARSSAQVRALGADGIVLSDRRDLGYLPIG